MKKQKSLTNKGFSLVELIIVVAIMAILIAILAPQYLRYVERSRLQKDNSAMDEVAKAVKIACADEDVINAIQTATGNITVTFNSGAVAVTANCDGLWDEVDLAFDGGVAGVQLSSNTYRNNGGSVMLTVAVDTGTDVVTISTNQWIEKVGGNPESKTF